MTPKQRGFAAFALAFVAACVCLVVKKTRHVTWAIVLTTSPALYCIKYRELYSVITLNFSALGAWNARQRAAALLGITYVSWALLGAPQLCTALPVSGIEAAALLGACVPAALFDTIHLPPTTIAVLYTVGQCCRLPNDSCIFGNVVAGVTIATLCAGVGAENTWHTLRHGLAAPTSARRGQAQQRTPQL